MFEPGEFGSDSGLVIIPGADNPFPPHITIYETVGTASGVGAAVGHAGESSGAASGVGTASGVGAVVVSTSYSNTGGTGNRTGIITVTWSGTNGAGVPSMLVNGTQADEYWWTAGQTSKILKFDFGSAKVIDEFKWYQSGAIAHGGSNTFEGSNDDSAWTTLTTGINLGSSATQTVPITNTTAYRYYRISVPGATSASPYLREIEFKIA